MPVFGSKKDFSKKDMNFFSEFTEKAAKMARMFAYVAIAVAAVVLVMVALIAFAAIQNQMVKNDIKDIKKDLQGEEYNNLEAEYAELQNEISEKTQYLYALGEMRNTVDEVNPAKVEIANLIKANIPNDAYVSSYIVNGASVTITGETFNYYNAAEFVNLLQKSNLFTSVTQLSVDHYNLENAVDETTGYVNLIDTYYTFSIQATLTSDIHVTVKRYLEGDAITAIGVTEIGDAENNGYYLIPGEGYSFDTIKTATQGSETYELSYVLIDGVRVSDEDFQTILDNDAITGTASSDTSIELYYKKTDGGES
ncbi:MAG: PilN domain-containing protein [Clostridiales bacterium]|nr:PilN domain-containing protein [Clostridiales bacterium]